MPSIPLHKIKSPDYKDTIYLEWICYIYFLLLLLLLFALAVFVLQLYAVLTYLKVKPAIL